MNPGSIVLFDGDADKRRVEWELENRLAPEGDPERPPKNAPKDRWVRYGILGGLIFGAVVGALIGWKLRHLSPGSVPLFGLSIGAILGIVLGAIVGIVDSSVYHALARKRSSQSR